MGRVSLTTDAAGADLDDVGAASLAAARCVDRLDLEWRMLVILDHAGLVLHRHLLGVEGHWTGSAAKHSAQLTSSRVHDVAVNGMTVQQAVIASSVVERRNNG